MAKRKDSNPVDPTSSLRWPNLFKEIEVAEVLVVRPEWAVLLADLRLLASEAGDFILHNVPTTDAATAEQNFFRGKIAAFEDLLGLAEEVREWKEKHK
jgi:hypothetical protein